MDSVSIGHSYSSLQSCLQCLLYKVIDDLIVSFL